MPTMTDEIIDEDYDGDYLYDEGEGPSSLTRHLMNYGEMTIYEEGRINEDYDWRVSDS